MTNDKTLKTLRFWRRAKKISQKEMALRLNISTVHYSNMERGYSKTTVAFLKDSAEALGLDLLILITDK